MKQVCLLCERTSLDNNLYCQETYCPAETSPLILSYGSWLGDIEIVKALAILRSSVLYEARHQKKKVFLKVAHPGVENTDRLKRESEFLRNLQINKEKSLYLPIWLPPYANTTVDVKTDPYGRAMLGEHLLYYFMFEHFPGEPLRDVLTKNPQLWITHIGWLMINISSSVAELQSKGMYNFGLSPESVLVHFDEDPNVPRIMMFDLGIACTRDNLAPNWYSFFVPPAYTAPELVRPALAQAGYHTDVYNLGLILYELLVGEPCVPFKLRSDEDVYKAVENNERVRMNRTEDVKAVADIALQAVSTNPNQRYQSAAQLAQELMKNFNEVPGMKKSWVPKLSTTLVVTISLLTVAFLITLFVTLKELNIF